MKYKRINGILNKFIVILIVFIVGSLLKERIDYKEKEVDTKSILEIYFFDVGQADSILLKEDDYTVLIDGGNKEDGENLVNYLKDELDIETLDMVVGTHPHEDHIGGLPLVIDSFEIDKLYLPNATTTTKIFEELLDSIEDNDLKINVPKIGENIKLNNMDFKVLYTGTDESDLNNTSIVLKLLFGNTSYLFMGDATDKTEEMIINKNIKADVLKVGHHGSKYSTTESFLDKVRPSYAIIQVGENNSYNHPGDQIIKKLNDRNIKIYRTDIDGTIKIVSDGKKIDFFTLDVSLDG